MKLLMMGEVIIWRSRNDDIASEARKDCSSVNCDTGAVVNHIEEKKNSTRPIGWGQP